MEKIDWDARRITAHKACPCLCQILSARKCFDERRSQNPSSSKRTSSWPECIDPCYNCAEWHIEIDKMVEEGKRDQADG